jgi:hypothetical protein
MALNTSGPISLGGTTAGESIAIELGETGTAQISLNDTDVRDLAGVASGAITMPGDFYGASSEFAFNITTGSNVNLRSAAIAAGWDGASLLTATITSGSNITSTSSGSYAFVINGSYPGGVTVINLGKIIGKGGAGGNGSLGGQNAGGGGGPAVQVSSAVTFNNSSGEIRGAGGGGGAGGYARNPGRTTARSAGGAGGGGVGNGPGGTTYGTGGTGTLTTAGSGAAGAGTAGRGGNGGSYGSSGSSGTGGAGQTPNGPGAAGGSGGAALVGNSNVTWDGFGTRSGSIS